MSKDPLRNLLSQYMERRLEHTAVLPFTQNAENTTAHRFPVLKI